MKKRLSAMLALVLCFMLVISTLPMTVFADEAAGDNVDQSTQKTLIGSVSTGGLDNWGAWNGTVAEKVAGAAEDGVSEAWVLTGGSNGGGAQFSLNVGGFVNGSRTFKDDAGNTIATTKGFVDASEFSIRYKSQSSFSIKMNLEYRRSGSPTRSTKNVWVESSNGEWATATFSFDDFAPSDAVKDQWVHNIYGAYVVNNFEPVVLMRVEQLNQGANRSMTIDSLTANWYKEDMVSKVEFGEQPKLTYFQNYDEFDYSTGTIKVYRGGSETEYEEYSLDDPRVEISGFNNTSVKSIKMTVKVLNSTLTYNVNVVPFAPETLTSIQVNNPKTSYFVGDPFDFDTGLIQANYSDKDPEFADLDDINATVEGFDSETAGEKTITVTYGGKSTTYTVNVKDYAADGITSISVRNLRKVYKVGDNFYYYDGEVVPYKGSTMQPPLKLYNRYVTITGFDSSEACEDQVITVEYSGVSTTYTIDVMDNEPPILRYATMTMQNGSRPSLWYNDKCKSEYVAGAGEDGVSDGWLFTGSGTAQTALTGGWGTGDVVASDGKTVSGLVGADALEIRYRSFNNVSLRFILEYRASGSPSKSTQTANIASTNGEWATAIIPMSAFEPSQTGESSDEKLGSVEWVYNGIKGAYTTNFEPVVKFYVGVKNGADQNTTIGYVKSIWYDNFEGVESISVQPSKTTYYNGAELDKSGTATIVYKDGSQKTGPMSDFNIVYTGFDSNAPEGGKQIVTASYGNVSTTFEVEILTGGNEIIAADIANVRTVYLVGDEFDTSVGTIVITRANGQQEEIPISDPAVTITGFDSSSQKNMEVTIAYGDRTFPMTVRVFTPNNVYSAPSIAGSGWGSGWGSSSSGSGSAPGPVTASIKVQNRIACPVPQTAVIFAVAYGQNNTVKLIKPFDNSDIPASSSVTLSVDFTTEELAGVTTVKLIALDGGDTLNNLLDTATVVYSK